MTSHGRPVPLVASALAMLGGCGSVTALPPLPTEGARAGILVRAGSDPAVFAFALGPGQPVPELAPFTADSVPPLAWLTYGCPLSVLGLAPGRLPLEETPKEDLLLAPPARTFEFDDGAWIRTTLQPEAEAVLRLVPLDEANFCPGSIRGVEREVRLLSGGDRGDDVAFARILPVGDKSLVLRGLEATENDWMVERFVDGATLTVSVSVTRILGGQVHELQLGASDGEDTLREDSGELPYLEGTTDAGGVTLWGRGRLARFGPELGNPDTFDAPLLQDAESIRALAWLQRSSALAVLVVDDQPELDASEEDELPRTLRLLGSRDMVLEELALVERTSAEPPELTLLRLDDGRVLVRGLDPKTTEGRFVSVENGTFVEELRPVPAGSLHQIEGQTYIFPANPDEPGYVYESGLFTELPERPTWPFLSVVERQATVDGRSLLNEGGIVAERVDAERACPVEDLGRSSWDAVVVWADRWAFLERGTGREAGLFLVRPVLSDPVCSRTSEGED